MRALIAGCVAVVLTGMTAFADPVGKYDVEGTNPSGSTYSGSVSVQKTGDTYKVTWTIGGKVPWTYETVESVETVAARIRAGLKYVKPENLIPAPDCGMKYLPREVAFGKLKAMVDAAALVRKEVS